MTLQYGLLPPVTVPPQDSRNFEPAASKMLAPQVFEYAKSVSEVALQEATVRIPYQSLLEFQPLQYHSTTFIVAALTGNCTVPAIPGARAGMEVTFVFTQDATGSRLVAFNGVFESTNLDLAPNSTTAVSFKFTGTAWKLLSNSNFEQPAKNGVITVDAIATANASALGIVNKSIVFARGRTAVGDGGGGLGRVALSAQPADGGLVFDLGGGLKWFREGWTVLGPSMPMKPEFWGAYGDGVDRTTEIDAMMAAVSAYPFKHIQFVAGVWRYEGSGITIKGSTWYIETAGEVTRFTRQTNGKLWVLDARTAYVTNVTINGFRAYTTLADGSRGNTYGVEYLADPAQPYGFAHINIFNVVGSGVHSVIHFTKTKSFNWNGYDQLQLYYKCQHININSDDFLAGTNNLPKHTVLYDSGTGNVNSFIGGYWRSLDVSCKVGDGDQACHDTTWNGVHFLGITGGLKVLGPSNPAYYRSNIGVTGGQFDGATSGYSLDIENLNAVTVLGNNWQTGVTQRLVNVDLATSCIEDENKKIRVPGITLTGPLTVAGNSTFTGNITTTSAVIVDPNGTRIGQTNAFRRNTNAEHLRISGGNTSGAGAQIVLWGGASAAPDRLVLAAARTQIRTQDEITNLVDVDAGAKTIRVGDGAWNGYRLALGTYQIWVDSTGDVRIKNGTPTSDTDGTVIGTQT